MSAPHSPRIAFRATAVLAALFAVAAVVGTWGAPPAEASSYRFWSYWIGADSGWSFSSQGASRGPADGTVDGWRFAISEASSSVTPPRQAPSFNRICGSTSAVDGSKRVGLVVDFGTAADAPDGEKPAALISTCVVAPDDANGYEVLASVVTLRTESGLICGMNGYPATECGAVVADPTSTPTPDPSDDETGGAGSTPTDGDGNTASQPSGERNRGGDSTQGSDPPASGKGDHARKGRENSKPGDQKGPGADEAKDGPLGSPTDPVAVSPAAAVVPAPSQPGSPIGMVIGIVVVGALLATAYLLKRRRT